MSYQNEAKSCEAEKSTRDPVDRIVSAASRIANAIDRGTDLAYRNTSPVQGGLVGAGQAYAGNMTVKVRKGPFRDVQTAANNFGEAGRVTRDQFVNSTGASLYASLASDPDGVESYDLSMNGRANPMGLRELACELAMLADHLDGNMTIVSLSTPSDEPLQQSLTPAQIRGRKAARTRKANERKRAIAAKATAGKKVVKLASAKRKGR